jgi:hypothetical protein
VIPGITGYAAAQSNTSTLAEIQYYYSIALSSGLADGVTFNLSGIPFGRMYFNTTENYNLTNNTLLWITLSTDSNSNVDLCTEALSDLVNGTSIIGASNITWSNSTLSTIAEPALANARRFSLSYQKEHANLSIGNNSYLRLWVDIPFAQPAGFYNNTLDFKAIKVNDAC